MKRVIPEQHIAKVRAVWALVRWLALSAATVFGYTCGLVAVWALMPLLSGEPSASITMSDFHTSARIAAAYWSFLFGWRWFRTPEDNIATQVKYLWRGWGCMISTTWGSDSTRRRMADAINKTAAEIG